jgi:flagellar basal-body rod modification protein FlgD
MTVSSISGAASGADTSQKSGLSAMDQGDFMTLMTKQLTMQDPFNPVDQKEMLAQMAQFSSLAGTAEMSETLQDIAAKLDAILAAQNAAAGTAANPSTTD